MIKGDNKMNQILGFVVGFIIGLIVGEALEKDRYKAAGAAVSVLVTIVSEFPGLGDAGGYGLAAGFITSHFWEPNS